MSFSGSQRSRVVNHLPVEKVVVPVDFSDASLAAVDVGLQFAASPDGVHVIYVLPIITDYEAAIIWESVADGARQQQGERALREKLPGSKYEKIQMKVRVGDAGHEVADYAREIGAQLIVVPSHGRRGLSHLLIGSVAERIVRLADCPVLVLKQPRARS
jgi:nucleotide-binding universal stress UspA family protein